MDLSNTQAETSVLAIMSQSEAALCTGVEMLKEEDFSSPVTLSIFCALKALYAKNEPPSMGKIIIELKNSCDLEVVGGIAELSKIICDYQSPSGLDYFIDEIREKSALRKISSLAHYLSEGLASSPGIKASVLTQYVKDEIAKIEGMTGALCEDIKDLSQGFIKDLEKRKAEALAGNQALVGFSTGIPSLDSHIGGLKGGDVVIIGARTSMGKTALALNIAANLEAAGVKSLFFSLEMKSSEILDRFWAARAGVELSKIKSGTLSSEALDAIRQGMDPLHPKTLFVGDKSSMTMAELCSSATRVKESCGIQAIFVDYLQFISLGKKVESKRLEVAEISKTLKTLAKSLDIPIVCCAQLSRMVEDRPSHKPILSDLAESSSIEQDADVILGLWRRDYYDLYDRPGEAELEILKNRNGPIGTVTMRFNKEICLFTEKGQEGLKFAPGSTIYNKVV